MLSTRLNRFITRRVLVLCLGILSILPAMASAAEPRLDFDGLGSVRIDMRTDALKDHLSLDQEIDDCKYFVMKNGAEGVRFVSYKGVTKIAELLDNSSLATSRGVRVGDSARVIEKAYKDLHRETYRGEGRDIVYVKAPSGRRELAFHIEGGKITRIEAGDFTGFGRGERCG